MSIFSKLRITEEKHIKKMDGVCLLEVAGKNIDINITFTKDKKILVGGKKRPLPREPYYITSVSKLFDGIDLKSPMRAFILNRDDVENMKIDNIELKSTGKSEFDTEAMDLIVNSNIFVAMIRGLSISRMQMILYGCMGIVAYEIIKGILFLLIEVLK